MGDDCGHGAENSLHVIEVASLDSAAIDCRLSTSILAISLLMPPDRIGALEEECD